MAAFTISLGLPRKQFRGSRIPLVEEAWSSYLSKGKSKHLESATCAAPVLCGLYLLNHFTRMISLEVGGIINPSLQMKEQVQRIESLTQVILVSGGIRM